jgi:hypothetical protein
MTLARCLQVLGSLALTLLVPACSSSSPSPFSPRKVHYHVTEPLKPRIYPAGGFSPSHNEPRADGLTPILEWKAVEGNGMKYDLVIYTAFKGSREQFTRGTEVYYREAIEAPHHTVETALQPHTYYCWSVRTRTNDTKSAWATYDLDATDISGDFYLRNAWWTFATP